MARTSAQGYPSHAAGFSACRPEARAVLMLPPPHRRTSVNRPLENFGCHLAGAGYDALVTQTINLDGLHCLWVLRRPDGLYAFERGTLQFEDDENGSWSWWRDVGQSRSGLFATADATEREARAVIAWLQT